MKKKKSVLAMILCAALLLPTTLLTACKEKSEPPANEDAPPTNIEQETTPPSVEITPPSEEITPPTPIVSEAQYIRCTGSGVNLRSGAGAGYSVIGSAQKGEIYAVAAKVGEWYKTYYRGKEVYISANYAALLALDKGSESVEKVLDEGYKLIGVPYVYGAVRFHDGKGNLLGGFNAQKFDCSSLVQYVFYKGAGKVLDVTTRTQVKQGKFIKKSELARGDCIYFTNESRQHLSGNERVGHVAIYLGNDYILHTASDYARIEKMTASRWAFYIEARRFV